MVMMLGEVVTRYTADVSGYSKGMGVMESETAATGAKMGAGMTIAGLAIAATAIAIGTVCVKMASDFQTGITTLETGAGESAKNLNMVADGIKRISVDTGTMTGPLIAGMFMIESAGYRGATGLSVLEVAAKGAKVSNSDLGVTADALTTVMKDYGLGAGQATTAMNFLSAVVKNGKTHMEALAASMSSVLPTASSLHVHLLDVGAAMATMTGSGIPAADAATYLRQTIVSLSAELPKGAQSLKDIGLSAQEVSAGMKKSMPDTLQLIMDHLQKTYKVDSPEYVNALRNIAGGSKQMQGMLALTGVHLKDFQQNMKNVSGTMNENKNSVAGWAAVQGDLSLQVDRGKAALAVLAITIGTALLPVLTRIVAAVAPIISAITNWLVQNHMLMPVLAALGIVVGVLLVAALVALAVAAWAAIAPFALIALAVVAAIAIIVVVIMNWGKIVDWLKNVWATIATFFIGLWNSVKATFTTTLNAIAAFFVGVWTAITAKVTEVWNAIHAFLTTIWNVIKMAALIIFLVIVAVIMAPFVPLILFIKANWTAIHAFLTNVWNAIKAVAMAVWGAITAFISIEIRGAQVIITAIWNTIRNVLTGIWNAIKAIAGTVWNAIGGTITGVVTGLWNWLVGKFNDIKSAFTNAMNSLKGIASSAWDGVLGVVKGAINGVIGLINGMIGGVNNITGIIGLPGIPMIPSLASGVENFGGGLAYVHKGEVLVNMPQGTNVVPANRVAVTASAGSGGASAARPGSATYILQVDGREMALALGSHFASEIRLQLGLR